jgi:hypothetical protein
MESFLAQGLRMFSLDWAGIITVALPVEDDILFLGEDYLHLRELLNTSEWSQVLWLSDGAFVVRSSKLANALVSIEVTHTPHLRAGLEQHYKHSMSEADYRDAWTMLIEDLMRTGKQ